MSNYTDIETESDRVYALDTRTLDRVCIMKSVSDIYRIKQQHGNVAYLPVTYRDHRLLSDIEDMLRGRATPSLLDELDDIYVRFGYLDENLGGLQWISLVTFYRRWCEKSHTKLDDGKLQGICKMLSISKRDLSAPITRNSSPPRLLRTVISPHLSRRTTRRN